MTKHYDPHGEKRYVNEYRVVFKKGEFVLTTTESEYGHGSYPQMLFRVLQDVTVQNLKGVLRMALKRHPVAYWKDGEELKAEQCADSEIFMYLVKFGMAEPVMYKTFEAGSDYDWGQVADEIGWPRKVSETLYMLAEDEKADISNVDTSVKYGGKLYIVWDGEEFDYFLKERKDGMWVDSRPIPREELNSYVAGGVPFYSDRDLWDDD